MPATLLVRTWNIFHGRDDGGSATHAHLRRKFLDEMAALAVSDAPALVLLQEVPVWAGKRLQRVPGYGADVVCTYGPHVPWAHIPLPEALGKAIACAAPDLAKTQFEGQAQAVLFNRNFRLVDARRVVLNDVRRMRGEPRIAQLVRLHMAAQQRDIVVMNVHTDGATATEQLSAAVAALDEWAPGVPAILGGDFNSRPDSEAVQMLLAQGWQERASAGGIDHILVRGFHVATPTLAWEGNRRDLVIAGARPVRLSDHAPVDVTLGLH